MGRTRLEVAQKKTVQKLQSMKICPVTNGLPTTMTLDGFKEACERCREQDRHGWEESRAYKHTWCDTCQGNRRPKELRIISLEKLIRDRKAMMNAKGRGVRHHSQAR